MILMFIVMLKKVFILLFTLTYVFPCSQIKLWLTINFFKAMSYLFYWMKNNDYLYWLDYNFKI